MLTDFNNNNNNKEKQLCQPKEYLLGKFATNPVSCAICDPLIFATILIFSIGWLGV